MKMIKPIIGLMITTALLSGCDIAGPAYPERDGRKYLITHGYPTSLVDRVVNERPLAHSEVLKLSKCRSTDVRFLVARNGNLTHGEIDLFICDKNDFARSGTACNMNLSPGQIDLLTDDPSHTVYCKLAGNTALSDETLLRLHKKRNPGLLWFAMNPNCPASIRQEIVNSDDALAKHWLDIVNGWKRDGCYKLKDDGRWHGPFTPQ